VLKAQNLYPDFHDPYSPRTHPQAEAWLCRRSEGELLRGAYGSEHFEIMVILKVVKIKYFSQKWNLSFYWVLSIGASQEPPVRYFIVVCFTAATLMTLDLVSSGLRTFGGPAADTPRVTVIFKNRVEPTLAQLDLRAAKPDRADDVNSDIGLQPRLTQGI
jgi:hypothetical protein